MSTEPAVTLEVCDPKLALVVKDNQLEPDSALSILTTFQPLILRAREWEAKVAAINVTDASQTREMELARVTRLALREVRINSDKTRKRLKESSLRLSKSIDGAYNLIAGIVEPLEEKLQAQEDFIKRQEMARKEKLKLEREAALAPFAIDTSIYVLAEMSEPVFQQVLASTKLAHEAKAQAALKAEQERLAKEAEEAKQREAVRIENERLKKEAVQAAADKAKADALLAEERARTAAVAAKEKAKADAALATQRAEAEKKAKETADKAAAELAAERKKAELAAAELTKARKLKEEEEARIAAAAKAAAAAPDKDKLKKLATQVRALQVPSFVTPQGQNLSPTLYAQIEKFATWIDKQGETL